MTSLLSVDAYDTKGAGSLAGPLVATRQDSRISAGGGRCVAQPEVVAGARDFASVYYCPPFASRLNSEEILSTGCPFFRARSDAAAR
jgi:hypothetical protein